MENIVIRKPLPDDSNLIYVDVDGNTNFVENNKELLKEYILELIDKL